MNSSKFYEKKKPNDSAGVQMRTTTENCFAWYLVTTIYYFDGTTETTEQYLYTTCDGCSPTQDCADGGGGGGGGGETGECEIPDMVTGTQTASETISINTNAINDFTKNKNIEWRVFKHPTWSLHSHENGVIKLVDVPSNKWEWQSLTHNSISFSGVSFGGTISHTNGVGTPSFTAGTPNILFAGMSVNFNVTFSPVCNCPFIPSFTYNYTSTQIWAANP